MKPDQERILELPFRERIKQVPADELKDLFGGVYPLYDPESMVAIGDSRISLEQYDGRAFHITTTDVLKSDVELFPLAKQQSRFELATGKLGPYILSAFGLPNPESYAPDKASGTSELHNLVFVGNTVSKNLLDQSRDASFLRLGNAKDMAFAAAVLAWQVRQQLPPSYGEKNYLLGERTTIDTANTLQDYTRAVLGLLGEESIQQLIQKHVTQPTGEQITKRMLEIFGITGPWGETLVNLVHHRDSIRPSDQLNGEVEKNLIFLALRIPSLVRNQPPDSVGFRVPIVLELDAPALVPVLDTSVGPIPYCFYTTRPPSIMQLPKIPMTTLKQIWVDPQVRAQFLEFAWLTDGQQSVSFEQPTYGSADKYDNPTLMVRNVAGSGEVTPISVLHNDAVPKVAHCSMRYGNPADAFRTHLTLLEQGDICFLAPKSGGYRTTELSLIADELEVPLTDRQRQLFGQSIFDR